MAIAFVRSTQVSTTGGSTSTVGFNVASAAGNTLVLLVSTAIGRDNGSGAPYTSVISNISGTTFTRVASGSLLSGGIFYEHSQIWVASNIPAGQHLVTVNAGANSYDYGKLSLIEFSGVSSVSAVDVTAGKTGDSALGQFNTSITTATTTQPEELVIACFDAGGETDLTNYFSTGIVTPSGFTSVGFDDNARLGNRAFSHSYRTINTQGSQAVSWGTVANPGAGERLVWTANVATLKAQVSALVVSGTTRTAPASLLAGSATVSRSATPSGQTLAATGALIVSAVSGGKSAVAGMAIGFTFDNTSLKFDQTRPLTFDNVVSPLKETYTFDNDAYPTFDENIDFTFDGDDSLSSNSYTFDSTTYPTSDSLTGPTFDKSGTLIGVISRNASLLVGNVVGVPVNATGAVNFVATTLFTAGTVVARRQASVAVSVNSAATSFVAGIASALKSASLTGDIFVASVSFNPGQNISVGNAIANGVAFAASSSLGKQTLTFTFDSSTVPTFDRDNNYTADAEPVSASQSSVPFGVIYGRQSSLLTGSVTSTRLGIGGGIVLPAVTTVLDATPSTVVLGAIPGTLLTTSANFIGGSTLPQRTALVSGFDGVASTALLAGSAAATTNAVKSGSILSAVSSLIAGSATPQTSWVTTGVILSSQSAWVAGSISTATNTTTPTYTLPASVSLAVGVARGQKNAIPDNDVFVATTALLASSADTQTGGLVFSYIFGNNASLLAGSVSATKSAAPFGRLLTGSANFIAGGINGLRRALVDAQTLVAGTNYPEATSFAIQAVQHPGQTFLIRPELLAGGVTPTVNATVNGQTLSASASLAAGNIVYFAAVTVLSQTIAAQSAFLAGAVTGKQLTRRNTGGRAFNFLQEFLQPIVGQELIFSEQNGPRPAKPYATLSVRSISEQPIIQHQLNGNGIISLAKLQRMIVEVEYFGLGAFSKAQILGLKLQSPSNVIRGDEFGISVSQLRGVSRVPELLNQSQYEERAILEFTAYIMVEGDDDVGLIEHAIIQDTDADHACNFDFVYEGSN